MDLASLRRSVRRFWLPSLGVLILTIGVSYVAATRGATRYQSTSVITVVPNPQVGGSADAVRYHLPAIVERVGSRSFWSELAETLPSEVLEGGGTLIADNDTNTGIVRITARGADRRAVSELANAAADEVVAAYLPADDGPPGAVLIEIIDRAGLGDEYGGDNLLAIVLAGFVLGLILAAGAALLLDRLVRSRDTASRLRDELGVPVLAIVPAVPDLTSADADIGQLVASGPPELVEAVQALRTRTESQLRGHGSSLAVTSWQRGEGSTTITAALGITLAAAAHDVVMIDADLREPRLHERLAAPLVPGLADLDHNDVAALFAPTVLSAPTVHDHLRFVAAGVTKSHPSQILSVALPAALAEIAKPTPGPTVLIDSPPLSSSFEGDPSGQLSAEALTVVGTARRILLVIDTSITNLSQLESALGRLRDDGIVVIGAVLNRPRRRRLGRR